jgi:acetoin utilization protein AcuB
MRDVCSGTVIASGRLMKKILIENYMTSLPSTIGADLSVAVANVRMHEKGVRHLPVLAGGRIVGIISERDIAMIEGLPGVDLQNLKISEAMTQDPFTCDKKAPLADVAAEMAARKIGSALVVDKGRVIGIFTTVDGLQALAELLQKAA